MIRVTKSGLNITLKMYLSLIFEKEWTQIGLIWTKTQFSQTFFNIYIFRPLYIPYSKN